MKGGHFYRRHLARSLVTGEEFEIFEPVSLVPPVFDLTDAEVHRRALRRTMYPMREMRDARTL